MRLRRKLAAIFDGTLNMLFLLSTLILILISLTILTEVVLRTFFSRPITGTVEINGYALVYVTFLGAAWLLREGGHVRMDIVLTRLRPGTQTLLNIITSILGAIICLVVTWYGAKVSWYSLQTNYLTIRELEVPVFPIVVVVPLSGFLLSIQFLRRAYGYLELWRGARKAEIEHAGNNKLLKPVR